MGRKCGVEGCLSDSNRPEDVGVTFHKVPMHSDIRPKWISLCRIPDDKKSMKVIYICSRHFLRMDFCNFKGKKYLLRQGVLPSVFPWDKSKLEAIKSTVVKEAEKAQTKRENEKVETKTEPDTSKTVTFQHKEEEKRDTEVVNIFKSPESKTQTQTSPSGQLNLSINAEIEALDDNNTWYPAKIVEEDYEENEVLVHFEKTNKHDEWISKNSPRLRAVHLGTNSPKLSPNKSKKPVEQYVLGERCLASWSDARKFPATINKVLENDTYEVIFDDGYAKVLKAHRMCKAEGKSLQAAPLFDPIQSSKEERREKKRKINIAALFGKRQRLEHDEKIDKPIKVIPPVLPIATSTSALEIFEPWVPHWDGTKPVGIESSIDAHEGTRKSYIVPDPRLPEGWTKHLAQRVFGASAGKWDTIIVSPDSRRFRTRSEIKSYLEETKEMVYNWSMFDFSIHRHRNRRKESEIFKPLPEPIIEPEEVQDHNEISVEEEENKNLLKIPIVNNAYQCPIEGCGKNYRKENLAQMHVKHYHPEYTRFLDSTPNVADLAYARTVGESLDKSPNSKTPIVKSIPKNVNLRSNTKLTQELEHKPESPVTDKYKDSEIVKLLNTKTGDSVCKSDDMQSSSLGVSSNIHAEARLKDVLTKNENNPNRDEMNLRALSGVRSHTGIKTLLPVIRPEKKDSTILQEAKSSAKRKKGCVGSLDSPKGNEYTDNTFTPHEPPPLLQPNNIIIEGGQVIRIVRMKQEEIINCTCGYTEEDGLMIQCDLCLCWQHAFCNNIERESQVPEKYVCFICQNPARQRISKKYYHDQDWLKLGVLATTDFHTKDEELLRHRFEKLKKSHDISGGLIELCEFVNSLKVKLKIAEAKNHPKLYLWSKPWDKPRLPEKGAIKDESEIKPKIENLVETESIKNGFDHCLNNGNGPIIPQPEAYIDSADCRLNLVEHIAHSQSLVEERLDGFEKQIDDLENASFCEENPDYPRTRQTLNMLLRDLNTLQELSHLTTL